MRAFNLLLVLAFTALKTIGCGWSENAETVRLAMFKASCGNVAHLHPFCYSADLYLVTTDELPLIDQQKNCNEWVAKLGKIVKTTDVYNILYKTSSEEFEIAYTTKKLATQFSNNTFVQALLLPNNATLLTYLVAAKSNEYNSDGAGSKWESWTELNYTDYNYSNSANKGYASIPFDTDEKLAATTDVFLKQRYAFLLLRQAFYEQNPAKVLKLYNQYFEKNTISILHAWATYYMALCTPNKALSNYYLSKVFAQSYDKAFASRQHFNSQLVTQTLDYTQNDTEKGIVYAMEALRNPAPALNQLKNIYGYIPHHDYFNFLIGREINKLEDWILTPKYTQDGPAVKFNYEIWYVDYAKAVKENYTKDSLYLLEVKTFLITIQPQSKGQQREFINAAIAHLCYMNDEIKLGTAYANAITSKANASIQLQKNTTLSLVLLKQNNITTTQTKQQLYTHFAAIEEIVNNDKTLFKTLYTLCRIASKAYAQHNDQATAGLLFLKSEKLKEYTDVYYNYSSANYTHYFYGVVGYFERFATVTDMDNLITLLHTTQKTDFEKYICTGTLADNENWYKDVKGTIAFRNNDLELAYSTFASMPSNFWQINYEFKNYLNENPFFPKALQLTQERKFNYSFNKATFVAKLLQLQKLNTVTSNMQLAHAYFNVSYWGNAWMMSSYEQSSGGGSYADYKFGGGQAELGNKYQNGNYYQLTLAQQYYRKALQLSTNKEQKALASLMLFECQYYATSTSDTKNKFTPSDNFKEIYTTAVYKNYSSNCGTLAYFLK